MIAFDSFKEKVVRKYQSEYACGKRMSTDEISYEFDMTIGKRGYNEFVRVEELCKKQGKPFPDPVESACDEMDMLI